MSNTNAETIAVLKRVCEPLGVTVRSYSGRGMYGKECLGFSIDGRTSAAQFAFKLAIELTAAGEEFAIDDLLDRGWSQDSMGMGTIVYVPGFKWEEPSEDEEDVHDDDADNELTGRGGHNIS